MAKPAKRILVFSVLEQGMGTILFVLNSKSGRCGIGRLRAIGVHKADEFRTEIRDFAPDAALIFFDGDRDAVLAVDRAAREGAVPALLVCRKSASLDEHTATMQLGPTNCTMADILYSLGIALSRRKGPRSATAAEVAAREAVLA